jgi:hypothetical protein
MKTKWLIIDSITLCGVIAICSATLSQSQPPSGIPEPGMFLFGSLTNTAGGLQTSDTIVTWKFSDNVASESVNVAATLIMVNGQFFHVARVPFETRSIGTTVVGRTSNVLNLTANSSTYARSAWVGTNPCTFLDPSQTNITFSKSDRGRNERVDLSISVPTPALDTDGDGMPDWAELMAGTDPHDPNSVLRLSADVRPSPQGGLEIKWSSISGKSYAVYASTNLNSFSPRATNIVADSSTTVYHDPAAIGSGPFFYRIKVNPDTTP